MTVHRLRMALEEESRWVKVHAAEALLAHDYPQGVRERFEKELETSGSEPEYRIGIWRVLARASVKQEDRQIWVGRIRDAFLDPEGPDRIHAAESLAKLRYRIEEDERPFFEEAAASDDTRLATYALWVLALEPSIKHQNELAKLLASDDLTVRLSAAYALRYVPQLADKNRARLVKAAQVEPVESLARTYLYSTIFIVTDDPQQRASYQTELLRIAQDGTPDERREACHAFFGRKTDAAYAALFCLSRGFVYDAVADTYIDADIGADERIAASEAFLQILSDDRGIGAIGLLAIALLVLGISASLWYYLRRRKTTDD